MKEIDLKDVDFSKYKDQIEEIERQYKEIMMNPIFRIRFWLFKRREKKKCLK